VIDGDLGDQGLSPRANLGKCGVMPYASVIIPAYNAAGFITDAYRSVIRQTIEDWEIIFVDDGSQDDTLAIVRSLAAADKRIKIVEFTVNSGPAAARNAALAIAEGKWIAPLDADDQYSPDRLEVLIRAGERAGADIVLDNQFVVDPSSRHTAFLAFEPPKNDVTVLQFSDFLRNIQSNTFFDFGYLQPVISRRWLKGNNIKYSETLRLGEDLMFMFDCYASRANVILLSEPYYHYYFQYSQSKRTTSATSRTEVRYEPLLAAAELFLEKHYSTLSPMERCLIVAGCESLRETMIVVALRICLKEFYITGVIRTLWHPIRLLRGIYFAKRRSLLQRRRLKAFSRGLQTT
jgi:succinoglycan biosynthesis protein ExoO